MFLFDMVQQTWPMTGYLTVVGVVFLLIGIAIGAKKL
jgi:hypothetical protein